MSRMSLTDVPAGSVDSQAHDIRFVEDNWESPVLGAWGLGWEVWLDGMEVTQFTYFQQAGGKPLPVPAVEITYGLERIIMSLQGVSHFKDIVYAPGMTYGEMFMQNEYEMSVYNLDSADVQGQRERFDLYEKEARKMLEQRLPVPAYDHLLKLSHTFNIMDARGAVGVTERAECFAVLRSLAREVTALWVARREEQEFPLGLVEAVSEVKSAMAVASDAPTAGERFVLEVGTEELPPEDLDGALEQLRVAVSEMLERTKLSYSGVSVEGTPRRIVLTVDGLVPETSAQTEDVRGPPAKVAYKDDSPTPALTGFCKKNGINVQDCRVEEDSKGTGYVWATVTQAGRPTSELLVEEFGRILKQISFKKSMKWRGEQAFSRPVRWIFAMHGGQVLPIEFAGLVGGSTTRVLRTSPDAVIGSAAEHSTALHAAGIIVDVQSRKDSIWESVNAAVKRVGGVVPEACRGDLLSEVANLVESPTIVIGKYEDKFLGLPKDILVMVMRKHQRYFPVYKPGSDELLPYFVTVANGAIDEDKVREGNEAVIRARFEDAQFFYEVDRKSTLEDVRPKLSGTTFQKELGSLLDKTLRVENIVHGLAELCRVDEEARLVAQEAAHIYRADLATSTVTEMTALAGIMGKHYALMEGKSSAVATAIFESVLPRNAGDELPTSAAGSLLSAADKVDSLVGLFACGCGPTASADPYGLRRAAVGLLQVLMTAGMPFDLRAAIEISAAVQPVDVPQEAKEDVHDFVLKRLEQILVDEGVQVEAVRAAVAERGNSPSLAAETAKEIAQQLESGSSEGDLQRAMAAMARAVRITRTKEIGADWEVDPTLFESNLESDLYQAYKAVSTCLNRNSSVAQFAKECSKLVQPLDAFFESVFVMADDQRIRTNRLALLRDVAALQDGILDLQELPGF